MKMKLNSVDVLQIAKALKCGWLDTDRIESFKSLVDGYNPPKEISRKELSYYLDCLYKGWGYEPTEWEQVKEKMLQGLDGDLLEKWKRQMDDGSVGNIDLYNHCSRVFRHSFYRNGFGVFNRLSVGIRILHTFA